MTAAEFKKLAASQKGKKRLYIGKPVNPYLEQMKEVVKSLGYEFETEYRFDDKRKFRMDIFIPVLKVGIEYEGTSARKSNKIWLTDKSLSIMPEPQLRLNAKKILSLLTNLSRHQTFTGMSSDCEKYNLAQIKHGIPVLRYTVKNYMNLKNDLIELAAKKSNLSLPVVEWQANADNDFVFRCGEYCLHVEQMDKKVWWWAMYYAGEELAASHDSKESFAATEKEAKLFAELCFAKHFCNQIKC